MQIDLTRLGDIRVRPHFRANTGARCGRLHIPQTNQLAVHVAWASSCEQEHLFRQSVLARRVSLWSRHHSSTGAECLPYRGWIDVSWPKGQAPRVPVITNVKVEQDHAGVKRKGTE